jgi:hypothetical protein
MKEKTRIVDMLIGNLKTQGSISYSLTDNNEAQIILSYEQRVLAQIAKDFFEALCLIRLQLEAENIIILCNGSRYDAYPSGMSRQMSNGLALYIHKLGEPSKRQDLVNIFDRADMELISSVSEQKDFYYKWLASLSNKNS